MASNDYEIVNLALVRLGATRITSLADGSRNANEANAIYGLIRDEVLRSHPWGFATAGINLVLINGNELTITNISQADPGVVTYTGTDPEDGDAYLIDDVTGMTEVNEETYMIQGVNGVANTFNLYNQNGKAVDTTLYTPYVLGGSANQLLPNFDEWDYAYQLPTDVMKILQINENPDELFDTQKNRYLYCNSEECFALVIKQITDVTKYDPTFVDAFAWRLAQELSVVITGSMKKLEACAKMHMMIMQKAKAVDASEKRDSYPEFSRYKDARR